MIPFSPPRIDDDIINEVVATLKSGWITTGPRTKQFEQELTNFNGNKSTLAVSSATAGMELILRWFGIVPGDEVIIPAYTYCATANVIIHCGATPIMADINPNTFNIDISKIEKLITPRTKVIIPVDIAGLPCDYEDIFSVINSHKHLFKPTTEVQKKLGRILLLADAAHSLGAVYKGKRTGSVCDISVFSFHAVKNLTTAEGGAIALNLPNSFDNNDVYKYLNIYSLHGQSKDALAKSKAGNWQYDVITPGYKANMTDISAAIGLIELKRYQNDTLPKRKEIFNSYFSILKKYEWAVLPIVKNEEIESSYHVFLLRIKNASELERNQIIQEIFKYEVSVNVHFQPLPMLTAYKNMGYKTEDYPIAMQNYKCEISLPVYYDLTNDQVETVLNAVIESVAKVLKK
ncbi:MAG TPA: DegT/DnrJ/EryC1/StrS family aminotransferase [Bacteroidales bacterium]|jgi:dTDP-4-amino-4,6-dideoxygalactose transaminase|nr:DegT/DnrJ/EryC1/StrS family aminotransferase [Bacteroidales bacterium]MDY0159999.1 DegT/DnrJ/EryC1/StrS family aminotransferase [Bacteroidales bacterium]HXK82175.1 DegT/DnrJ/EryC1/StrS family aminotransferase [Bacteroidales bacterium]